MRKPFFWAERGAWYVKSADGRRNIKLAEDQEAAFKRWHKQQALAKPDSPAVIVAVVMEHYLRLGMGEVSAGHRAAAGKSIADFCNMHGETPVAQLKKFDLTSWLDTHPRWGDWARRGAAAAVGRALNWAVDQGLIPSNPLGRSRLPEGGRRETMVSDEQHRQLMTRAPLGRSRKPRRPAKGELAFRLVMIALRLTGARPGTVRRVEKADVTAAVDAWVMRRHKTAKKTKKPLTVYLSPCMQTLTRILMARRPTGPLFLNSEGKPWTKNALRCRFRRLRKWLDLPAGTVTYSYRHSFITTALVNGETLSTVAELAGHANVRMIAQNYSHLEQQKEHLRAAANRAVPLPKSPK